jgi:hypothetical protein
MRRNTNCTYLVNVNPSSLNMGGASVKKTSLNVTPRALYRHTNSCCSRLYWLTSAIYVYIFSPQHNILMLVSASGVGECSLHVRWCTWNVSIIRFLQKVFAKTYCYRNVFFSFFIYSTKLFKDLCSIRRVIYHNKTLWIMSGTFRLKVSKTFFFKLHFR